MLIIKTLESVNGNLVAANDDLAKQNQGHIDRLDVLEAELYETKKWNDLLKAEMKSLETKVCVYL
jgi:hypothetical protein